MLPDVDELRRGDLSQLELRRLLRLGGHPEFVGPSVVQRVNSQLPPVQNLLKLSVAPCLQKLLNPPRHRAVHTMTTGGAPVRSQSVS